MPVSFRHNLLFVHIPKTGGTSIRRAMADLDPSILKWNYHTHLSTYHKVLHPNEFKKMFKFSFVRNPWERTVSHYFWLQSDKSREMNEERWQEVTDSSFRQFVWQDSHDCLKYLMIDKEVAVDYIGRQENFAKSLRDIKRICGVSLPLKHLRSTKHDHYSVYYDKTTRGIVQERCKDEIEMFGYEFKSEPHIRHL